MSYSGYLNGEKFFDTSSDYDGYMITSAAVDLEAGASGSATIAVPPVNISYGEFNKLSDEVIIYRDGEEIFCGRVYGVSGEFNTIQPVTLEGIMAVLNDSIFPPETYECSTDELIAAILSNHNTQCPTWPVFVGNLEISDDYVYRAYENYETSKSRLDDLVDSYGGYLYIRHEDDIYYLDWLDYDNYTTLNNQTIDFGSNILDLTQESTADELITALIPFGATISEEDDDGETIEYVVDITSVNDGLNYIYDADAVALYGWIWGTYTWDDVTEPENLLSNAEEYLEEQCKSKVTIDVSAVDLANAGEDVAHFSIGDKLHVTSSPHGIDDDFTCTKLSFDLLNPSSDKMQLGDTREGFVSVSSKSYASNLTLIENIVANYATNNALSAVSERVQTNTSLITQLSDLIGFYVTEETTEDGTVTEYHSSAIEQTADAIYATIESISIGASNLLYNTSSSWAEASIQYYSACYSRTISDLDLEAGDSIVFSGWIKNPDDNTDSMCARIEFYTDTDTRESVTDDSTVIAPGETAYFEFVTELTEEELAYTDIRACIHNATRGDVTSGQTIYYKKFQLERGTVATDWSASTEDAQNNARTYFAADATSITVSTGTISFTSDTFIVDSTYFSVTKTGVITATSGTIGGWTFNSYKIYGGDSDSGTACIQLPGSDRTTAFAAGGSSHSDYTDAPFRVTNAGKLYIQNVELDGNMKMTGNIYINENDDDDSAFMRATRTDTSAEVAFGVGTGGYNRGVWDATNQRWMLHTDASNRVRMAGGQYPIYGVYAYVDDIEAVALNIYIEDAQDYNFVPILIICTRWVGVLIVDGANTTSSLTESYIQLSEKWYGSTPSGIYTVIDSSGTTTNGIRVKMQWSDSSTTSNATVYPLKGSNCKIVDASFASA